MADRALQVHKAIVARLRAASAVTAIVSTRIYDTAPDAASYPFCSVVHAGVAPFDGHNLRGSDLLIQVHCWSRKPGAVQALQMRAAVIAALNDANLALDAGAAVLCRWVGGPGPRTNNDNGDGTTTQAIATFRIITHG